MRIGIIGTGNVGSALARLWVDAGHSVVLSSRHPQQLENLVLEMGARSITGSVESAAERGDVVVLSIPLGGIDDVRNRIGDRLEGKTVIDTMNPFVQRDGEIAAGIKKRGIASGVATQEKFPSAKIVRAFSSVPSRDLHTLAHREPDPVAIPYAGDDSEAKSIVAQLIRDAGFVPYDLGRLAESQPQDPGGMLFGKALTRERIDQKMERVSSTAAG